MAYCANCGAKLRDGAKFCEACGASTAEPAKAPSGPRTGMPSGAQSPVTPGEPAGGPKGRTLSGRNIVLLVLAVLIAAACIIIIPGRIGEARNGRPDGGHEFAGNDPAEETSTAAAVRPTFAETAGETIAAASSAAEETALSEAETEPAQTSASVETSAPAEESTEPARDEGLIPRFEDFAWYTDNWSGVPDDAVILTDLSDIKGMWRGLIIYDPTFEYASLAYELITMEISGSADALKMVVAPYSLDIGDGPYDMRGEEPWELTGGFGLAEAYAAGLNTITINSFYEYDGGVYAVGSVETPDAIPAVIALIK